MELIILCDIERVGNEHWRSENLQWCFCSAVTADRECYWSGTATEPFNSCLSVRSSASGSHRAFGRCPCACSKPSVTEAPRSVLCWDGWAGTGTAQPSPVSTHQPCFYLSWWRAKFWGGSCWAEWIILRESPHWWLGAAASPPQGPPGSLHPPGSICEDNAELGQQSPFPSVQMAATASLAAHQRTEETPAPLSYCWQSLQTATQHKHTWCKQPEKYPIWEKPRYSSGTKTHGGDRWNNHSWSKPPAWSQIKTA